VSERRWLIATASVLAGAAILAVLVYPFVGSGFTCDGIGFGCTPERETDTLLVVTVYTALALGTLLVARRRARRGRPWRRALSIGIAITMLATTAAFASQLPRHPVSPGPLSAARERWDRVLADGRAVAPRGTPLGDALRDLEPRGPVTCRDAYGRDTAARELSWSKRVEGYAGSGAATAAALGRWAERLRRRNIEVIVSDPSGDSASDRRLRVGGYGPAAGGFLYVRASFYISQLEITASTGCHRG
jgi:hypothetical protein